MQFHISEEVTLLVCESVRFKGATDPIPEGIIELLRHELSGKLV